MMKLTSQETLMLDSAEGAAVATAMRIVVDMGELLGAQSLIPISSAHIDGCLFHGKSGVDFAEMLVEQGAKVKVPSSTNVGALDLIRPKNIRLDDDKRKLAFRLMKAYGAMGCTPSWTCAPYQAGHRPALGEQIAWAESNAVVFANSVLGARTNRYGDFLDIAAAICGRAPYYGLHITENRWATVKVSTAQLSDTLKNSDEFYPVLGHWLGKVLNGEVPVIDGLPNSVSEDQMKALGAAAASSGSVALFHIAGVTPEASSVSEACGGKDPKRELNFDGEALKIARDALSTSSASAIDAVAFGSPHFSTDEIFSLRQALNGRSVVVPIYACTSRHTLAQINAAEIEALERQGVIFVQDTCVVVTPIFAKTSGVMMTNSGKFAHYSKGNTGYGAVFGSLIDCVESAITGQVCRKDDQWL